MITKKAWFGWWWTDVSWEGFVVIAVYLAVMIGSHLIFGSPMDKYIPLVALVAFYLVYFLTGGKPDVLKKLRWNKY